jgi:hypothetical protein
VLVLDPMLATGGSLSATIDKLKEEGAAWISCLHAVAAVPGVERVTAEHPDVNFYTAAVDPELDERSFIVPASATRATGSMEPFKNPEVDTTREHETLKKVRPSWDEYFMRISHEVATRSTCPRLAVGAVIVRDKRILTTGYNGSPSGLPHCDDVGCLIRIVDGRRAASARSTPSRTPSSRPPTTASPSPAPPSTAPTSPA